MTDADAFLRTIIDHPREEGPRLVYADWLEERGECERADFIRVQCRLAAGIERAQQFYRRRFYGEAPLPDQVGRHIEQAPCGAGNLNCDACRMAGQFFSRHQRESDELLHRSASEWFGFPKDGPVLPPSGEIIIRRGFIEGATWKFEDFLHWYPIFRRHYPFHIVRLADEPRAVLRQIEGKPGYCFGRVADLTEAESLAMWRSELHIHETIREQHPAGITNHARNIVGALLVLNWPEVTWQPLESQYANVSVNFDSGSIEIAGSKRGNDIYLSQIVNRTDEPVTLRQGDGVTVWLCNRQSTNIIANRIILRGHQHLRVYRGNEELGSFGNQAAPIREPRKMRPMPSINDVMARMKTRIAYLVDQKDVQAVIRRMARRVVKPRSGPVSNKMQDDIAALAAQVLDERMRRRSKIKA